MPKRSSRSDPPLVCRRQFEFSRVQEQLWSDAYVQLVPERARRRTKSPQTASQPREKHVNQAPGVSQYQGGLCA
jgi:hypothetical protein